MSRSLLFGLVVSACGAAVIGSTRLSADDPVSSNVRFNREIIRILQRRCLACHSPGGLDISLATYRDVRDWSRAIREEVVEQRMPPSPAAPGFGRFQNLLSLTSRETTTLLAWLDGGMPRGDEKDLPPPFDPASDDVTLSQRPDRRFALPEQSIPALEDLIVRRVRIDPQLSSDRLVSRIVVRPGSRSVLRGAVVYQDGTERQWLGAWLPWQHALVAPEGRAFKLAKGTQLNLAMYYRGSDDVVIDRSSLEVHFAADGTQPLENFAIETSGGAPGKLTLLRSTTIWALQSTLASTTASLELRARKPDGSIEVLMWTPVARPEWPGALVLEEPVSLPAQTVMTLAARVRAGSPPQPDRVILSAWPATPPRP